MTTGLTEGDVEGRGFFDLAVGVGVGFGFVVADGFAETVGPELRDGTAETDGTVGPTLGDTGEDGVTGGVGTTGTTGATVG
ncbi:hypothetical protein ACH4PU_29745 [Streptomyces sp. NPDC021100]|uniref:hypothetical protein n=1 Tax=Streptomyces sp. NPDC021100 TaxID=3365114 RepID=UPI003796DF7B